MILQEIDISLYITIAIKNFETKSLFVIFIVNSTVSSWHVNHLESTDTISCKKVLSIT